MLSAGDSDSEEPFENELGTPRGADELNDSISDGDWRPQKRRRLDQSRRLDYVRPGELVYPLSQYEGHNPPLPVSKERHVVEQFTEAMSQHKSAGDARASATLDYEAFVEYELTDYSVYLPGVAVRGAFEMRALQNLVTKTGNSWYCFDGILKSGGMQRYVQCVPFNVCSIGNYGPEHHEVGDNIWIQSTLNKGSDLYYRLKKPSSVYERYHKGFIWLANLAKHFVDYLKAMSDEKHSVSIKSFRSDFATWLHETHGENEDFRVWFQKFGRRDFCAHISGNIDFLWKEAIGTWPVLSKHPIWKQVMTLDALPLQKVKGDGTVVTPYVYDCFSHLQFGDHLRKVAPISDIDKRRKLQGRALNLTIDRVSSDFKSVNGGVDSVRAYQKTVPEKLRETIRHISERSLDITSIIVGDVLGVIKDGMDSKWKNEQSKWEIPDDCWYVYVQGVNITDEGRTFDVIWLYKPSHTTCAIMKYPYQDELFLSDNCWHDMPEDEIVRKVSVSWGSLPGQARTDFFIRQTYLTQDDSFVTMKEYHKKCAHVHDAFKTALQDVVDKYSIGDTVLVVAPPRVKPRYGLQPTEIVSFIQEGRQGLVVVKRLPRRRDLDENTDSRPNELVYSEETFIIAAENVIRKCHVRFYSFWDLKNRMIPTPYDRDGTGDAYYILTRLVDTTTDNAKVQLEPIENQIPSSLIQGLDPGGKVGREKLRGLDLYCGGGNFGRGLEEGGAVHNTHAVDLNKVAIHSYYANLKDPESTKLYYGSVDDMLEQALLGNPSASKLIPLPGQIDFISAGSPCQGFSLLNSHRGNEQGLKNQSLVASVAAYVDVYRPKYALLENVVSMAQKGARRTEDVLSQLICCLVGIGYQVQLFNLDAWSFGSPQTRSRIFVSIVAPGLELPPHPELSHSHPKNTKDRGLGKMANNLNFGQRRFMATPFKFVTAQEATEDLPDIGDGQTYMCISHPDHRMPMGVPRSLKTRMELVPLAPLGMSFIKTYEKGRLTEAEREQFPSPTISGRQRQNVSTGSKAWERIHPNKLFPIIATSNCPACSRTGRTLHWNQQRVITVLEARRAQSFPDHEVLLGRPPDQWKIVGNSVARTVSLALGLSLREAWLKNAFDESGNAPYQTLALTGLQPHVNGAGFDEQDSSDEASDKQYSRSLKAIGLASSVSASRDEAASPASSLTMSEARERKRKFNINIPNAGEMSLESNRKRRFGSLSARLHSKLRDSAHMGEYIADEESVSEQTPKIRQHCSTLGSDSTDSSPITKRRQKRRKDALDVQPKPSKPSDYKRRTSTESRFKAHNSGSVHSDRRPVVLLTPASKKTIKQAIIPISDSEDELIRDAYGNDDNGVDDDNDLVFTRATTAYVPVNNDIFAPYELTYKSGVSGGKRRR
jgi:DNA (cytosine-5)-methyltransferase 1